jgi:DNA-binding TFAR19-related protein (PDSD5 family)
MKMCASFEYTNILNHVKCSKHILSLASRYKRARELKEEQISNILTNMNKKTNKKWRINRP